MKNVLLLLNIVLLAAVAFLFYKFYSKPHPSSDAAKNLSVEAATPPVNGACKQ